MHLFIYSGTTEACTLSLGERKHKEESRDSRVLQEKIKEEYAKKAQRLFQRLQDRDERQCKQNCFTVRFFKFDCMFHMLDKHAYVFMYFRANERNCKRWWECSSDES